MVWSRTTSRVQSKTGTGPCTSRKHFVSGYFFVIVPDGFYKSLSGLPTIRTPGLCPCPYSDRFVVVYAACKYSQGPYGVSLSGLVVLLFCSQHLDFAKQKQPHWNVER